MPIEAPSDSTVYRDRCNLVYEGRKQHGGGGGPPPRKHSAYSCVCGSHSIDADSVVTHLPSCPILETDTAGQLYECRCGVMSFLNLSFITHIYRCNQRYRRQEDPGPSSNPFSTVKSAQDRHGESMVASSPRRRFYPAEKSDGSDRRDGSHTEELMSYDRYLEMKTFPEPISDDARSRESSAQAYPAQPKPPRREMDATASWIRDLSSAILPGSEANTSPSRPDSFSSGDAALETLSKCDDSSPIDSDLLSISDRPEEWVPPMRTNQRFLSTSGSCTLSFRTTTPLGRVPGVKRRPPAPQQQRGHFLLLDQHPREKGRGRQVVRIRRPIIKTGCLASQSPSNRGQTGADTRSSPAHFGRKTQIDTAVAAS